MTAFILQNADSLQQALKSQTSVNDLSFDISNIGSLGVVNSLIGYVIVFIALVFLTLTFASIASLFRMNLKKKLREKGEYEDGKDEELDVAGEISAAISTALYLHFEEAHDLEDTVLTIERIQKPYRPWSSKLYGLRQFPTRK